MELNLSIEPNSQSLTLYVYLPRLCKLKLFPIAEKKRARFQNTKVRFPESSGNPGKARWKRRFELCIRSEQHPDLLWRFVIYLLLAHNYETFHYRG
jgi:hypothetical protein